MHFFQAGGKQKANELPHSENVENERAINTPNKQ